MFKIIEKNQKLAKGILILVAATFVLWGIGGYLGMAGDDGYVAKVGSHKIYKRDVDQAIEQNPQNVDKMQVLFGLINRQLLLNNFEDYHMSSTKEQLQKEIASLPYFQENGSFDTKKYQAFLNQRFLTAKQFEKNVNEQILLNQTLDFFNHSYFNSDLFNQKFRDLLSKERSVSTYTIKAQDFYNTINVTDQQINDYYQQNKATFTIQEQVKVQYIQLSPEEISKNTKISDLEINKYVGEHKNQISNNVQIDASHILFNVPNNASEQTRTDIKRKAQQVLLEVKTNPDKFATLAKKYSEDPGSAKQGGSLGFFGKGIMVKPFEDAAFKLKPGQISDQLVETQFGFHIIKLNKIKGDSDKQIREAAILTIKKQKSLKELAKQIEKLNDITYNQPKSLIPAAKAFGLEIQTSDWITKNTVQGDFANPKVQKEIFSNDLIKDGNNSQVVDLGNNIYRVYRVIEHKVAKVKPLLEVREEIVNILKNQLAQAIVSEKGQKDIELLNQGKLNLGFTNNQNVSLLGQSKTIEPQIIKQIFSTSLAKIPAYTGSVDKNNNFVIYRINGEKINHQLDEQNKGVIDQFTKNAGLLDLNSYIGYLRNQSSVNYNINRLDIKENS